MHAGTLALLVLALLGLAAIGGGLVLGDNPPTCDETPPVGDVESTAESGCTAPNTVPAVALLLGGGALLVFAGFGAVLRAVVN
jgi:hypothetical protein